MKVTLMYYPETPSVFNYRWPGLLSKMAFSDTANHKGAFQDCASILRGVNRTAQGTKLLLTVVLAFPVDCISLYCI